jgi:SNF2 family DNA or RNA helicase
MPALTQSATYPPIPHEKHPAWNHQRAAYWHSWNHWAAGRSGTLLAADMGCGKTKVAIDLAHNLPARNLLILAPMRVVDVWREQLDKHANFPYLLALLDDRVRGGVEAKTQRARDTLAQARAMRAMPIIAINYESAWLTPFGPFALNTIWDLVICDEIHRAKLASGKLSRFLAKLHFRTHHRLGMTGTPMPHSPLDVWAYFRFLNPAIFDPTWTEFKTRYAVLGPFGDVKKYRDRDQLNEKFYSIAFRVKAEDVLDLPPEMDQHLYCDLHTQGAKVYRDLQTEMIAWLEEAGEEISINNALTLLLRLQQLTGGTLKSDDGTEVRIDTAKEDLLTDWLEDLPENEPVVIFARFHADLDAIARACLAAKRACAEMSGRRNELPQWKAGHATVLAAQIQTAGEGQDLTRARLCAYYSMGFSLAQYLQSRKRVHRPGQTRPVVYYHFLARRTIDEIVLRAVEQRWNLVEATLKELKSACRPKPSPPTNPIWS